MATTKSVIEGFMYGETKGKASSVKIDGDKLFNYETVIAQRVNGAIVINKTKYSMTTTKHQNVLLRSMPEARTVDCVPMYTRDLAQYIEA